ncbi:MAG: hypothetical protein MZW92_31740 [Comamonadaceae bacterium]|nr:hypothetical protein [Comamonadaceae bacterium]
MGRYINGSGQRQARFIIPAQHEQPPDKNQAIWLSESIQQFSQGVDEWRADSERM